MSYEKWLVLPDPHIPYEDKITYTAIGKYMEDEKWDGLIILGDFLDFNEISKYNQDAPRRKTEKVKETFKAGNAFLDKLQKTVGKKCQIVLIEGNHDFRVEDYMDKHEELDGLLDIADNLRLKERGIKWVKNWSKGELFSKGHAKFAHGQFISTHHAKKMAQTYGACIFYGHTHDIMEHPIEYYGDDKTIVGKSLGCTCDYNQKYLKGNPTKWQQAISVFYFFSDGFFQENTIKIFKHRFVGLNGKVYDGKLSKC